jgi:hypothetical protein
VALLDNRSEDGGTVLVPGFHSQFDTWQQALGAWEQYVVRFYWIMTDLESLGKVENNLEFSFLTLTCCPA